VEPHERGLLNRFYADTFLLPALLTLAAMDIDIPKIEYERTQ